MVLAIDTERAYRAADIAPDAPRVVDGAFEVPQGPRLGVTPDLRPIERHAVDDISGTYLYDAEPGWCPTKPRY